MNKMKESLKNLPLKKRILMGYRKVIHMMFISGALSLIVIFLLLGNMINYINKTQRADTAIKICRMDVNDAARNIREMALNDDKSSYDTYEKEVEDKLSEVDTELKALKATGVVGSDLVQEYSDGLQNWGTTGYEIIGYIKDGDIDKAKDAIIQKCTLALNDAVAIGEKLDEETDASKHQAIVFTVIMAVLGIAAVVLFGLGTYFCANKVSGTITDSILQPLRAIEDVAKELTNGNLHSELTYHSDDEIGKIAHDLRKSINILSSYVDDIGRAMKEFSEGNFDVQPEVEWRGDFVDILDSFMLFEKSMANTVKGIQRAANEVSMGAEQVSESSNMLAEGATDQAAVVEELTASVTSIAEQVARNAESANKISGNVDELGRDIIESNGNMRAMVTSMNEINEASQEIDKIIGTINEIASQTNLLALNASIEAARAGEAGRGFAIVADQVTVLADQSATAAKESAALIETSVRAVEKGMVIADQTAQQLEDVAEKSKGIITHVDGIAQTLDEQTQAVNQINEGIVQINDVVQTNSAASEECAASSQQMNDEAENLKGLIHELKVGHFE